MVKPPWEETSPEVGETRLVAPCESGSVELAVEHVVLAARQAGFDEHDVARIRLAVVEACNNVLAHAAPSPTAHFAVSCRPGADGLIIRVWDSGAVFDPGQVPSPRLHGELERDRRGPLGLHLMRRTMDEVRVEAEAGGKAVVLVKRRRRPPG